MARWLRVPINVNGAGLGGECTNVWTIGIPEGEAPDGPAGTAGLNALNQFYDDISGLYPTAAVISGDTGYVYDDNVLTALFSVAGGFAPITGSGIGGTGPDGLSVVVRWRTAVPGRSGRGRTFIGPVTSVVAQTPEPNVTTVQTLEDAALALVAASVADTGWDLQIYSPTDGVSREVVATDVNPEFGYLRSRRT